MSHNIEKHKVELALPGFVWEYIERECNDVKSTLEKFISDVVLECVAYDRELQNEIESQHREDLHEVELEAMMSRNSGGIHHYRGNR